MTALLQNLVDIAAAHPSIVGVIVFFSAAAEAIVVVGAAFPGSTIVVAMAGVAGAAHADVWLLTLWAVMGAVVGDGVSFWVGYRYGDRLREMWPFKRRPQLLDRGAAFFEKHGGKSVFLARFLPGVRAVVPVAAGILGMTAVRFYIVNVASAVVWAVTHVLPAAGVGVAFVTLGNISARLALLAGIVLLIAVVLFLLARLTIRRLAPAAALAYEAAVARLARRPDPLSRHLAAILDPAQPRLAAVALWSAVLGAAATGFLGVVEGLATGAPLLRADSSINHLIQSLRTPFADSVLAVVTSFGDTVFIGELVVLVIAWLSLRRALVTAAAFALTMGVSAAFVFVINVLFHKAHPIDISSGTDAFGFPSDHTALATALYGVIAVLISKSLPRAAQIAVFTASSIIAGAIGLSQIYLGAHWPSAVLGGLFFGAAMTAAFALIFEHLPAQTIGRTGLAGVTLAGVAVLGTWHASSSFEHNLPHQAGRAPEISVSGNRWVRDDWQRLPAFRTDLAGAMEEPLVLQWAGDTDRLATILANAGWTAAHPWSMPDALQFLNPAAPIETLPPLPLLNDGRFPVITRIRPVPSDTDQRLVFRAWPSQMIVIEGTTKAPILLGSITLEEVTHPFGLITTLHDRSPPRFARMAIYSALSADKNTNVVAPAGGNLPFVPILARPAGSPRGSMNETGEAGAE